MLLHNNKVKLFTVLTAIAVFTINSSPTGVVLTLLNCQTARDTSQNKNYSKGKNYSRGNNY